jgi:hypothetical protein
MKPSRRDRRRLEGGRWLKAEGGVSGSKGPTAAVAEGPGAGAGAGARPMTGGG